MIHFVHISIESSINSLLRMGLIPLKKSVVDIGAFFTTSRLAFTCAGYFIPTTALSTDFAGIDLTSCRCRAGMLNTSGTAYLERGTLAVIP